MATIKNGNFRTGKYNTGNEKIHWISMSGRTHTVQKTENIIRKQKAT